MLTQTAQFLLDTLLQSYIALLLLRFHLQWLRVPLRNPLGDFVLLLTDPLVLRARRLIPSFRMLDIATFLLVLIVEIAYLAATLWLHNRPMTVLLLPWALLELLKTSLYLLSALFIEALISWTNPHAPFASVFRGITTPFLKPIRRFVAPAGNLDFSFMILFFLCYAIIVLPLGWLEILILSAIAKDVLP
jgi:YggT family protein